MCGIFCTITCKTTPANHDLWTQCKDAITSRGPDSLGIVEEVLVDRWQAQFCASTLWLQGPEPVQQPLSDSSKNILLWNGDVFAGNLFKEDCCDSFTILAALNSSTDVIKTLQEIIGPFSFIYYHRSENKLYFGRDKFGRHSLLIKLSNDHKSILISSVVKKVIKDVVELPPIGVFSVNLSSIDDLKIDLYPWFTSDERIEGICSDLKQRFEIDINIIQNSDHNIKKSNCQQDTSIEFLKQLHNLDNYKNADDIMNHLLNNNLITEKVEILLNLLDQSVNRRVTIMPRFCKNCTVTRGCCSHAKVGILFSGGLDCAILAVLAHRNMKINETIDLINVAFENKNSSNYDVPDRLTGKGTYQELLELCPGRQFNFIEVDVSQQELQNFRSSHIANIVYPLQTVIDDSMGCAVWFASRGKGTVTNKGLKTSYESSCRVILVGMGADEQFGGYMRHRTTLRRAGWEAMAKELNIDFKRIWYRNLGRDDRIICDHGRQSRLPYLDEDVVNYVQNLAVWDRCCPTEKLPPGIGDKLLLRLLAWKLRLHKASKLPKRAMQFGSRIANKKDNANNLSKYL